MSRVRSSQRPLVSYIVTEKGPRGALALTVEHPKCGTLRTYMVTNSIEGILMGHYGLEFEMECEKCEETMRVTLRVVPEVKGYSTLELPRIPHPDLPDTTDEVGLVKPTGKSRVTGPILPKRPPQRIHIPPPKPIDALFPEQLALRLEGKCPTCESIVDYDAFENDTERAEFRISGVCKECQDKTFVRR